jgi:hypothetical protein
MSGSSFSHSLGVGLADVARIEAATAVFRALDYRDGGGSCRLAVDHLRTWGEEVLAAARTDRVRVRMLVAQTDLCNLAGWIAFDTGLPELAGVHFGRALELARFAGRADLIANIYYRMGRVALHHNEAGQALQLFQSGQAAARESGSAHAAAILSANEAWAHANLGAVADAERMLGLAADHLGGNGHRRVPGWAAFFTSTELMAMTGSVYTDLALRVDRRHTGRAAMALAGAVAGYRRDMARSRAFCLISLSLNHLLDGDADEADAIGALAVEAAAGLKSSRAKDRMRPLWEQAGRRSANSSARNLTDRLHAFKVTLVGCSWVTSRRLPGCDESCSRPWCTQPQETDVRPSGEATRLSFGSASAQEM